MRPIHLILIVALVRFLTCASADTHYVSLSGGDVYPYTTPETAARVIQDGVDAAESGDVVHLAPGEYRQRAKLRDGLCLRGQGPGSTVILALEEGWCEPAITGAEAAEVMSIALVREQSGPATYPVGINVGPWPGQLVADCEIRGAFSNGIVVSGPSQGLPALIQDCTFDGPDSGVLLADGRPRACVDRCTFCYGSPLVGGSGLLLATRSEISGLTVGSADVLVDSCVSGGAVLDGVGSLRMANCLIAASGGLAFVVNSALSTEIYFCTIVGTYGMFCGSSEKITVRNTILWGPPPQLDSMNPASFDVQYCDVRGGWEGEGNIEADPMFLDPDKGDFRLRPGSPCIDAGCGLGSGWSCGGHTTPAWVPGADFAGRPRVIYGGRSDRRPDMGAYEYYINTLSLGPLPGQAALTWSCTFFDTYSVFYSRDLVTWHLADGSVGPGWDEVLLSWTDDGSLTGVPPSLVPRRFYRVLENP